MILKLSYISIAASIICGVMVFFLSKSFAPEKAKIGESWAVLVLDESQEDRLVRESLAGIGKFISESSQEVFFDDFSTIRKIPLDLFYHEVEVYDPRNDGYAAKLRSFFVRNGQRFFFLPLEDSLINSPGKLEKQVVSLLADMPHSFMILGRTRPILLDFFLLAAACIFTFFLCKSKRLFVLHIPVLLALAWGGAFALVLAAVLAGIWELLREPFKELYASRTYNRGGFDYAGAGFWGLIEKLKPFRLNLLLVLLLLLFFLAVSVAIRYSPIPLISALLSFFLVYCLSHESEAQRARGSGHVLFTPVLLFPHKARTFFLFPFMWPFIAASVLALLLPLALPGSSPSRVDYPFIDEEYFVSAEDYLRHIAFQQSFSFHSLDNDGSREYLRYYLGQDGLIAGSTGFGDSGFEDSRIAGRMMEGRGGKVPGFPLEKLMDFLIKYH